MSNIWHGDVCNEHVAMGWLRSTLNVWEEPRLGPREGLLGTAERVTWLYLRTHHLWRTIKEVGSRKGILHAGAVFQ